ncbi:hypothetical protein [Adhaeribacter aquaticus]|uniref:hypothetical protein n=1 Tax=Adhaeribacter aquaticus TaxID=299567 RepID=UPI00040F74ED|nr:hypothetical protein [Adhaeribacter aquaticus]
MFNLFRKKKPEFDELQYETIKRLVAELPKHSGWAATYEKKLSQATIYKLQEEGYRVIAKTHNGDNYYYKISFTKH